MELNKKTAKKRAKNYEPPLHIEGSFEEAIKMLVRESRAKK